MKTTVSSTLVTLVKHYESLHDGDLNVIGLQPKMCPAGLWTEGYGKLVLDNFGHRISGIENKDKAYRFSKIHTEEQAEEFLVRDLEDYAKRIDTLRLHLPLHQIDALISFSYNVGFQALKTSTLLRKIREKASIDAIENEFLRWDKANGKVLRGLTLRRKTEAYLYRTGELKFLNL